MRFITAYSLILIILFTIKVESRETYKIKKTSIDFIEHNKITLDGSLNERAWKIAQVLDDFSLSWKNANPTSNIYRTVYDTEYFYFSFQSIDTNLLVLDSIKKE